MSVRSEASRQLVISQLLQSFAPLKEKLDERMACVDAQIYNLTQNGVHPADLNDLNMQILERKAIKSVFDMIEELREDLHGQEPSKDVEEK